MLIKVNVLGGDHPVRHKIVAAIAFGVSRVTKEDTGDGTWSEFVRGGGGCATIGMASKNPKNTIGRR
jgi:hypothetical protein